jgi:hypothetical protein
MIQSSKESIATFGGEKSTAGGMSTSESESVQLPNSTRHCDGPIDVM